jgi:hypothetical protein
MSLLPCTSHRDPTHPFWAVAGGGGGGGGGPVIVLADLTGATTTMIPYGDSAPLFSIPFPSGIAVGDDFIFQITLTIDDFDYDTPPTLTGMMEFIAFFTDDDRTWGVTNTTYIGVTSGLPSTYSPVVLTLVAHRGANATDMNIYFRNRVQQSDFQILNGLAGQITFTKIGTGYVPP